jgi:predicted dehydrogenase
MNNIRFAVLGFGGAGRAHVRRLQNIKGVQVKIVYDPKISQLKKSLVLSKTLTLRIDWKKSLLKNSMP